MNRTSCAALVGELDALLHLVVLALVEGARGGEDGGGQVRDGQEGTVDDLTGEGDRRGWGRAARRPANAALVVLLDPAQDGDAVGPGLGVDGLVVVAAEQEQVGVLVPVLVGHRARSPRGPWRLSATMWAISPRKAASSAALPGSRSRLLQPGKAQTPPERAISAFISLSGMFRLIGPPHFLRWKHQDDPGFSCFRRLSRAHRIEDSPVRTLAGRFRQSQDFASATLLRGRNPAGPSRRAGTPRRPVAGL